MARPLYVIGHRNPDTDSVCSAIGYAHLKQALGGQVAIGSHITQVQKVFGTLFNAEPGFARDGSQFDVLLDDNGRITAVRCG